MIMNCSNKNLINNIELVAEGAYPSYEIILPLLTTQDEEVLAYLKQRAVDLRTSIFGKDVYLRGLIEISSFCKNDCYYCGIRRSNKNADRYRLSKQDILLCCEAGYSLGFRTFVLQGGEDSHFTIDVLTDIVSTIRSSYSGCAITLSLGEMDKAAYQALYDAGANRYLLRHETANPQHYSAIHPPELTLKKRIGCLINLKEIGYQVGCGMMVGSPKQTYQNLVEDLQLIYDLQPHMIGIGPFIPHHNTPFANQQAGSADLTCRLLSIVRLMLPRVLLPSTTALGTVQQNGRELGILSGANVVMPNLSPESVREKYLLYDNKLISGGEAAEGLAHLAEQMKIIGYSATHNRGDHPDFL